VFTVSTSSIHAQDFKRLAASDMTLTADYQVFLSTANPELLAKDAQLHYIPTTTSFREPTPIVKHLASQAKALKKKQENIISSIESDDAICLDIETTIEFVSSGGAYLPGLDDNLLSDRIVTFPIVRIPVRLKLGIMLILLGSHRPF
jgi:hypothetical protein